MCALLVEPEDSLQAVSLPTNAEAESAVMSSPSNQTTHTQKEDVVVGQYYVTLVSEGPSNTWYIASCEGQNENGTY